MSTLWMTLERSVLPMLLDLRRSAMTEQERRNVEDFYAHRAEVLKRIQQALAKEKRNA